jgi:hypothetical protein
MKVDKITLTHRVTHTITLIKSQFFHWKPFDLNLDTGPVSLTHLRKGKAQKNV